VNLAYDEDGILIEVAGVTHRMHCAEPSAAREVYEALQRLVEERDALLFHARRVRELVCVLGHEVTP